MACAKIVTLFAITTSDDSRCMSGGRPQHEQPPSPQPSCPFTPTGTICVGVERPTNTAIDYDRCGGNSARAHAYLSAQLSDTVSIHDHLTDTDLVVSVEVVPAVNGGWTTNTSTSTSTSTNTHLHAHPYTDALTLAP